MTLRPVRRITIHCPIRPQTLRAAADGALDALVVDAGIAPILTLIESSGELGDFGHYRGVCEIGLGLEVFTPQAGAQPTVGAVGQRALSATATIKTYVAANCSGVRLSQLLAELAACHPWEIPVIEVDAIHLFAPDVQASV